VRQNYSVRLSPENGDELKTLGVGSVSEGIRRLLHIYRTLNQLDDEMTKGEAIKIADPRIY